MELSTLTEQFLKFILDEKKPKDFVAIEEQELPIDIQNQIFGMADELVKAKLIKNLIKYGSPGNHGIAFYILPKGLSYFADKEKAEKSKKKSTNFKILITIIGAVGVIIAAIIEITPYILEKTKIQPTLTPLINTLQNNTSTITPNTASTSLFTITPTIPSTITPLVNSIDLSIENNCSFSNPVAVGVYDLGSNYIYKDILDRLKKIGLQPTWISPSSTYNDLIKYDVIYLPSGWAIIDSTLERHPKFLMDYVQIDGGGLIVEQPNSEKEFSPSFLPFGITYTTKIKNDEDWPLIIYDSSTYLTQGLDTSELSGPMDCAKMDSSYTPIVKGSKTGCTSLAITSFGKGRILICMGNASPSMENINEPMISDIALCRMFGWVVKEFD